MIAAILVVLGVPLWIIAMVLLVAVVRDRKLRKLHGSFPVRVLPNGKKRWTKGHGVWVSDVFAWRGSPAAWKEDLGQVSNVSLRPADEQEQKKLHRMSDEPVVASVAFADGETIVVAAKPEHRSALIGPFVQALGVA